MDQYKALRRIAIKYYPTETNYCTVIATAIATGWKFGKARSILFHKAQRSTAKGITTWSLHKALMANGYNARFQAIAGAKTLISAQEMLKNTKGTYFVYTSSHVTAIKDGVCEDWSNNDHGRRTRYRVESIYKIEKV
mgnify:FL=1|tara:strand:+ start:606 stop:1016 length:411 start_codon:yes stop_codon:yes gene_type:complete